MAIGFTGYRGVYPKFQKSATTFFTIDKKNSALPSTKTVERYN